MINLRYHIVSLTAVFLAIGIGLAFGSSFLDQATVNSLEAQLNGLQAGLAERDERIQSLGTEVSDLENRQAALDDEGAALLAGKASGVPVVVIANDGTDDEVVDELVSALRVANADVAGVWRLTDRFILDDDSEISDLAEVTGTPTDTATALRRDSVAALAALIRSQQALDVDSDPDPSNGDDGDVDSTSGSDDAEADGDGDGFDEIGDPDDVDDQEVVDALFDRGFIEYTPGSSGAARPFVPAGARVVLVGGAESLPDTWMLLPLAEALRNGPSGTSLVVATSAVPDDGGMSSLVSNVRDTPELRDRISSVEDASHFSGQAAVVLVVSELGTGPVGHYGLADGSTRLLPAPPGS